MNRIQSILTAALLTLLSPATQAGKIVTDSLYSKTLGVTRVYNIYLPDGYDRLTDTKYPVLYLLHGLSDTYTAWAYQGGLQVVADELARSGEMRPMVIVMPNAGGDVVKDWNGYFNMPGWAYEDFFFQEFIPHIESKYRITGDKGHRAVSGLSMGGGGSIVYCQHHPDMFCACYAFSAWIDQKTHEGKGKLHFVQEAVHEHAALPFLQALDKEGIEKMKSIKWFFDMGDDDFLLEDNMAFYMQMRKLHIPAEQRVRDGIHNWEYWHTGLRTSLPFISRSFDK